MPKELIRYLPGLLWIVVTGMMTWGVLTERFSFIPRGTRFLILLALLLVGCIFGVYAAQVMTGYRPSPTEAQFKG
jgi:hypothetical protein